MSLRVWLPLIGNLNNYGTNNVTITNSNASVDTAGKIGSCYSFNGSTSRLDMTYSDFPNILNGDFSVCFWLYSNDSSGRSIYFGNWSAPSGAFFNIEKNASEKLRFYWNGNPDLVSTNLSIPNTTWCHIAVTRKANTVKFYLNGVLKDTFTSTLNGSVPSTATLFYLGKDNRAASDATALNGKLNDFRLYDNELSQKQIKEISKALVVHFPLNGNGLGIPNMVDHSSDFSGWSAASGWTKAVTEDGNTYRFTRTGATANNWVRLIPTALKINGNNYPNGITVSMDLLTPDKSAINQKCLGSIQTYQSNGSRIGWAEPGWDLTNVVNNQWSRISYTFSQANLLVNNTTGTTYDYTQFSFQLVQNGDITIRKIKIEPGNKATPYTASLTDVGGTTEIDSSGYKRNGTRSGTITAVTDTPRYTSSTYLTDPAFITYQAPSNMYYATYSFWFKFASFTGYGAIHIPAVNPSSGDAPWFSCNTESVQLWAYFGGNSPSYTKGLSGSLSANTWYHAVYVWNNGVAQWYLNGVKHGNAVTYTGKTYIPNAGNATIGDSYTGSSWNGTPFTGNISDFRLYATVLSDTDIKELYNAGASIDNKGSVYSYEFNEI